jgi:hypothetical protein
MLMHYKSGYLRATLNIHIKVLGYSPRYFLHVLQYELQESREYLLSATLGVSVIN